MCSLWITHFFGVFIGGKEFGELENPRVATIIGVLVGLYLESYILVLYHTYSCLIMTYQVALVFGGVPENPKSTKGVPETSKPTKDVTETHQRRGS